MKRWRGLGPEKCADNYFLYIRIIQYLIAHDDGDGIRFDEFSMDLELFFDNNIMLDSTKMLLWARLIDEIETGARDIGRSGNYKDIHLRNNSRLHATETTKLYFYTFMPDFDYISSMAMVSPLLMEFARKLPKTQDQTVRMGEAALCFLNSWLIIVLYNYSRYRADGILDRFLELFMTRDSVKRPWRNSVDGVLYALSSKATYADEAGMQEKSAQLEELKKQLSLMQKKGVQEIRSFLGDSYLVD